ncbi:restriction endonuclease [Bacillus atrophaeus]|uniref:BsuBI/PstI family type II restriction endonuclease n=1 Tax=Bacillus atrophaeus TaxID=1452 RepID=UPI0022802DB2|nr:BsuBI/PstI family type II restriction endonuclease [Bacillus atrophaeus]MCY8484931.1 restriction endonuclease [Bacillus atrophaeus]
MGKLAEAKEILKALGMPKQQYNDRSGYVLLALAGVKEEDSWADASINSLRIVDMMNFMGDHYGKIYKPNSRETIRKESIHQFVAGAIAVSNDDDDERATNSPKYSYRLSDEIVEVLQSYGTDEWEKKLGAWLEQHETLVEQYTQAREMSLIPVVANGQELVFSPGKHNHLQKAIIEDFAPRFAPGAEVLYVGDTKKKDLIKNREKLQELGVRITDHDKLPDVVLYVDEKNWLYFIEAVTSVGPISMKRINEIQAMLEECSCGVVYVTAFLDMSAKNGFKKFIDQIAWETEIWVADNPDHMIHLNGDRFFGPRN